MFAAIILAGGESRRMGCPKALLELGGQTFLEILLERTQHPRIGCRRVVLGAVQEEILGRVALAGEEVVRNADWKAGQLSSLQAGLHSLRPDTEGALVWPVDHPLVSAGLVAALIAAFDASHPAITIPCYRGRRGHPVIFSNKLYPELLTAPLDIGARAVVRAHLEECREVPTEERGVVLNLNDPEGMRRALQSS